MIPAAMNLEGALAIYGYPVVFLGALAEGEMVLLAAGYLARRHHLAYGPVVLCAVAAGVLGDETLFFLGRAYGEKLLDRLPRVLRARASQAKRAVGEHPVRVLLSMRFVYGMRILLPLLCGMSTIPVGRYVRYNVATAIVWATLITGLGFAFGAAAEALLAEVERYEVWFVLLLPALALVLHRASKWLRGRMVPDTNEDDP